MRNRLFYDCSCQVRVSNGKGLTMACQLKYVRLYERMWREVSSSACALLPSMSGKPTLDGFSPHLLWPGLS